MIVLLTGASGFLGSRLVPALREARHEVVCVERRPDRESAWSGLDGLHIVRGDFAQDTRAEDWLPRLAGVQAVINAAGILRERGGQRFEAIHVRGPAALFEACARLAVPRVIQVSALGADEGAQSAYHLSKRAADTHLLGLGLASVAVVQPSLLYGSGGISAQLFTCLASLPLVPLPGRGDQAVQPMHVDDAVQAIVALLVRHELTGRMALVGPQQLTLREWLRTLRYSLGLGPAHFVPIPLPLMEVAATLGNHLPGALLDQDTWGMLQRGNVADAAATTDLLGRAPRPASRFIAAEDAAAQRSSAVLGWCLPLLRWSIAAVWIVTGIVSLAVYPVQSSFDLLARAGVAASWAPLMLLGASLLDLALGIGTLVLRHRPALWLAQIVLMAIYTLIITLRLPEFWAHPYGPILKNLPMLAAMLLLYALETPRRGDR